MATCTFAKQKPNCLRDEFMGSFPSAQHWRDPTWNAMSRFGLPQTDKTTWSAGWKESSGRPGGQGEVGEHKMQGEAEGTEIVQSRAEKSSSCSISLSKQDGIEDELTFRYVQGIKKGQRLHSANMGYSSGLVLWCESPRGNYPENLHPFKFQNVTQWGLVYPEPTLKFSLLWVGSWSGWVPEIPSNKYFQWFCASSEAV